jgi:hypothetical protein
MVMCSHNIRANETEELVFDFDSEEQFTLDHSDWESTHGLSEYSKDSVQANQVWHDGRTKDRATLHLFTATKPALNYIVASHITGDFS